MNLTEEDIKIITKALIKASNATETEWLNIEKTILESLKFELNENLNFNIQEMWNQLYQRVVDSMKRSKILEDADG